MVTFRRTITENEKRNFYLNLTDDSGERYGSLFPPHRTPLWIRTGNGQQYKASKHGDNQIWGMLRYWFNKERIEPGTVVEVSFDPTAPPVEGRVPVTLTTIDRVEQPPSAELPTPSVADTERQIPTETTEVSLKFERDLEDFLANNLHLIEDGLALYTDEDKRSGRQYPTDVGTIDILCKNRDDFVILELKKGRTSDEVVGQISRYIGWVKEFLAEGRNVRGIIIVHDFDPRLKYAVRAHDNLQLKYYEIQLKFIDEVQAINRLDSSNSN